MKQASSGGGEEWKAEETGTFSTLVASTRDGVLPSQCPNSRKTKYRNEPRNRIADNPAKAMNKNVR